MSNGTATVTKILVGLAGVLSPIPIGNGFEDAMYSRAFNPAACKFFIETTNNALEKLNTIPIGPCSPLTAADLDPANPAVFLPIWIVSIGLIIWGVYGYREEIKQSLGIT